MESQSPDPAQTMDSHGLPNDGNSPAVDEGARIDAESTFEEIDTLQTQLRDKEQLVSALTDRLEQAAEQLDRYRRSGADRNLRVGGGGFPAELIEEQKTLIEDLQRAVEQWDDMQTAATLGRIEMQIGELRDLVAQRLPTGGGLAPPARSSQPSSPTPTAPAKPAPPKPAPPKPAPTAADGTPLSSWEKMKAGLMAAEDDSVESQPSTASQSASAAVPASADEPDFASDHTDANIPHVDPPLPIDFTQADSDVLREAVETRDSYISYLLKKLRAAESNAMAPIDWDALSNAPEEMQARLQELERRLEEKLRIAEVELSLERARLGREEAKLRQLNEYVHKNMKKLGINVEEIHPASAGGRSEESAEDQKGRKWLRMLGLGNANDESDH